MGYTLEIALYYIGQGWQIFPAFGVTEDGKCRCGKENCESPGKHPVGALVPKGVKDATTSKEKVKKWFSEDERHNLGIRCGEESGLVVLDVDPRHNGDESLKKYAVPETLHVKTGGGGHHYYFKHPGVGIRCSANKLGEGLDVRAKNGYVIAPPSRHVSGKKYAHPIDIRAMKLANCPQWLINQSKAATGQRVQSQVSPGVPSSKVIKEGERDQKLASIAGWFRHECYTPEQIEGFLTIINQSRCKPPVSEDVIHRISHSIGEYESPKQDELTYTSLSDYEPEEVEWMWKPFLPLEELTMVTGPGEVGKSTLLAWMAARVATGGKWFRSNGTLTKGKVLWFVDEENLNKQTRPKVDANGGGSLEVKIAGPIKKARGGEKYFNVREYMQELERLIDNLGDVKLLIFDPITSYLKGVNANDNAEVREALLPMQNLARSRKLAIVMVSHMNKKQDLDAVNRTLGSVAWTNVVRSVIALGFERDENGGWDQNKRAIGVSKGNLVDVAKPTYRFKIDGLAMHFLDEDVDITINQIIEGGKGSRGRSTKRESDEYKTWLEKALKVGPVPAEEALDKAADMQISTRTAHRIANAMSVVKKDSVWRITPEAYVV